MLVQLMNFREDVLVSPCNAKNLGQPFQVVGGCFADGEDRISKPNHTKVRQLFVKNFHTLQ